MADSAAINSPDYWNHRFAVDWTARGGAEQTSFFAQVAIAMLPDWFWEDARKNTLSFVDVGCALGEALPDFRARLPRNKLTGIDVSRVAIRMARERLPNFTFRAVKEDWSDAPRAGVMYCSNTLEHLKDWRKRLSQLSELADNYVLMLVPFQEKTLIDEHVVRFDFTSFPASLPDGKRLLYFRILDAAQTPDTHWPGHQALAIYGAKVSAKDVHVETSHDPYAGADFRGRTAPQVKASLLGLQAAYPATEVQKPIAAQGVVDRINAEWAQKLEASTAEMSAKHAELRAHYERLLGERDAKLESSIAELVAKHGELRAHYDRVLGERDAKISQLSELQAWRQRAQDLEKALHENLTQQIKRGEDHAKALGDQLIQARVDVERLKAELAQAERAAQRELALAQEQARAVLADRQRELEALRTHVAHEVAAAERKVQALSEAVSRARDEAEQRVAAIEHRRAVAEAQAEEARAQAEHAKTEASQARSGALQTDAELHEMRALAERSRVERDGALAALAQAKADLERVQAEPKQPVVDAVSSVELEATRASLAERTQEVEALKADVKRAIADNAALKAAVRSAVDERDEARAGQGGLPSARAQALEAEVAQAKEAAQESERILHETAAAHALAIKRLADEHGAAMRDLVAALDPELDALRRSWQGDYARFSNRTALLEQHTAELRTQLLRVLTSKSLKIGTSVRRVYWTLLGQPGAPSEAVPAELPKPVEVGSEFLRVWDRAKRAGDSARRAASAPSLVAPQAPRVVIQPPPPASVAPPPPPAVIQTPAPPVAPTVAAPVGHGPRVIALQAASLGSGGLERVVFDLAIGLKARGETVIAIAINAGGTFADELRQRGIAVYEVNRDVADYERVLRENRVTDLFAHHSYFGYERAASLGLRLYDVIHNYYFWHRNSGNMIRRVADLCTRVIYVSAAVRAFHERLFGVNAGKGVVITNPVHLDGLIVPEKAQLQRLREKSAETIFLNVAQAFPSKAQPAMITAFARAWRKNKNMRLQIAGAPVKDDAARAVRARIDAEGVGDAVDLLGHCDRRRMSRLYAEAHAFVLPSLYEGYSVSAIEAATYGLPLILTNVGGAEDLIARSGCGILLPPATDDLSKFDPAAIEKLGLASENAATPALEQAFLALAAERPQWTARALDARYDIRSLDDAIDAYLATIPADARAHV